MNIKTICYAPEFEEAEKSRKIFYFDEKETLDGVIKKTNLECYHISLESYYPSASLDIRGRIPYIKRKGKILWNLSYKDVTLKELIETNNIDSDKGVELKFIGIGGCGGDLISGAYELWIEYAPLIHTFCDYVQDFVFIGTVVEWAINHYKMKEESTPEFWDMVDFLEKSQKWDIDVLCDDLGLKKTVVSSLLISIGFVNKKNNDYVLNKNLNKRFHKTAERKKDKFWGDMYISAINVNVLFLKYLNCKYGVKYKEKVIDNKIEAIANKSSIIKRGKGIRCLEFKRIFGTFSRKQLDKQQDVLFELFMLTEKEVNNARKKCRL